MRSVQAWLLRATVCALGTLLCGGALADSKRKCLSAFEDGQRLQLASNLKAAAEKFAFCSSEQCPLVMHDECARLLDAVRGAMSSVSFKVKFAPGLAPSRVSVAVDGAKPQPYSGEVLHVEPGKHQFLFQCERCRSAIRRITFTDEVLKQKELELNADGDTSSAADEIDPEARAAFLLAEQPSPVRAIAPTSVPQIQPNAAVSKQDNSAPPASKSARRVPPQAKVEARTNGYFQAVLVSSAALSVLGGVGFVGFGLEARRAERDLSGCSPRCSPSMVAVVKRDYLLANVSLATGLASLLGGALLWASADSRAATNARAAAPRQQWALSIGPVTTFTRSF